MKTSKTLQNIYDDIAYNIISDNATCIFEDFEGSPSPRTYDNVEPVYILSSGARAKLILNYIPRIHSH